MILAAEYNSLCSSSDNLNESLLNNWIFDSCQRLTEFKLFWFFKFLTKHWLGGWKNSLKESVVDWTLLGELINNESIDDVDNVGEIGENIWLKSKQDESDEMDDEEEENKDALSGDDRFELTEVSDVISTNELAIDSMPASTLDVLFNWTVDDELGDTGDVIVMVISEESLLLDISIDEDLHFDLFLTRGVHLGKFLFLSIWVFTCLQLNLNWPSHGTWEMAPEAIEISFKCKLFSLKLLEHSSSVL